MIEVAETTEDWLAEDIATAFAYVQHDAEPNSAVAHLEQSVSAVLPRPLRDLYLQHGGFDVFDTDRHLAIWIPPVATLLDMRSRSAFGPEWPSLYTALTTYGSRREFDDALSPSQIAELKRYFVFGSVNHRYEDKTFFVFSSAGDLGAVRYEHDFNAEEWNTQFLPLCNGNMASMSLNELLEPHIHACTHDLRQRLAENNW